MLRADQARFQPVTAHLKNSEDVVLRFLATDDTDALGDFYLSIERAACRFYCPTLLTREDAVKKAAAAEEPTSVTLVAEDKDGRIVGYAWYRWKAAEPEKPSIFGICLRKAYRGAGLGKALMARLFDVAEHVGPPVMCLTVQLANPRAVALYTRMGFRIIREQERRAFDAFPAEPEYYMERPVRG